MYGFNFLNKNEKGNLEIAGCDCVELAKEYGTPLYVMNEEEIRKRCRDVKENHIDKYNGFAVFASKAFLNKEMCRIIASEGLGLDVVSGGELYTARSVNFPMNKVLFHGNNKSVEELEMAIDFEVGRIMIDNFCEIENLNRILEERNIKQDVMMRLSPGVDGHTHDFISTGQLDSKFGFSIQNTSAEEAVKLVLDSKYLNLKGFHAHIGSQLHDNGAYKKEIEALAKFSKEIYDKYGFEAEELNVGGGFGIYYVEGDERRNIAFFADLIDGTVSKEYEAIGLKKPMVIIEPGRWLVGEAGITLYTVGSSKDIPGVRKYVSIDGGMADNPRPPLYGALYSAAVANSKKEETETEVVTIAGRCCESGDVLIRDIELPKLERGDILAVLSTGAYNFSMASNYNRIRKPAVVMVKDGTSRIIVKRETYEDLLRNDI